MLEEMEDMENTYRIRHNNEYKTAYAHLRVIKKELVKVKE